MPSNYNARPGASPWGGRNKQLKSGQRGNVGLGGGGTPRPPAKKTGLCGFAILPALVRLPLVMWRHRRELNGATL